MTKRTRDRISSLSLAACIAPPALSKFLSLDEQPIAAASIAQVHHGMLKDHKEVAIKVGVFW